VAGVVVFVVNREITRPVPNSQICFLLGSIRLSLQNEAAISHAETNMCNQHLSQTSVVMLLWLLSVFR
jgi:hypothetical protein